MCLCCGGAGGVAGWFGPGSGRMGWCYICVCCESGIFCGDGWSRYLCVVLGGYLCILGVCSVQFCCTISISDSQHVFVCSRYHKSRLSWCCCQTWISLNIAHFYEVQ